MKLTTFSRVALWLLPSLCLSLTVPQNANQRLGSSLKPRLPPMVKPRSQVWVQTFAAPNGGPLNLLALLDRETRVTHVYMAAIHLNDPPGNIHLNDVPPEDHRYDFIWPQIRILQQFGIKIIMLLGGAAQGSYQRLSGPDEQFEAYYTPLLKMLRRYGFDGIDLDIEENVDISVPLRLLRRLDSDLGPEFILTMAPVASAMFPRPWAVGLSGFDYNDLDRLAVSSTRPSGKLVDWYNCQFYNGWGDANDLKYYNAIAMVGKWEPSRIVMGILGHPGNGGSGFVSHKRLAEVIRQLRTNYPTFGGVIGWEYFNAGGADGFSEPWQWVKAMSNALYDPYAPRQINLSTPPLRELNSSSPWPGPLRTLVGEGAEHFRAVRALNMTDGDLKKAERLLF
ncbi:Cyclin-dependent kinase catalytic subunit [Orbilia blumenaviensis]|uniref:chitinase n=1 Tax=Orbilia blumenaviensis TaxID=1796055 RepID=A0AAV9UTD5_9PEZI